MRTEYSERPRDLETLVLCRRCREEYARERAHQPRDDRYSFEVFRRAVVERDEHCRHELVAIFDGEVRSWCRRAARGGTSDLDELVRRTWERFWQYFTVDKLRGASTTAETLNHLKLCVLSVVQDTARERASALLLDKVADRSDGRRPFGETNGGETERATLRQGLDGRLLDDCERVLVHLRFELGLTPSEVQTRRPDLFPSRRDVYRVTRTTLDSLRRHHVMCAWSTEPCD
jgi:hypothetical protein